MTSTGVVYAIVDGKRVPAWTCGCGEERPGERHHFFRMDEPIRGIWYGFAHESCIEPGSAPRPADEEPAP
jgi:hypothetical protein